MTVKFQIPFLVHLTYEQLKDMKDDINVRIQGMNEKLGTHYKLEYYNINVLVGIEEVNK